MGNIRTPYEQSYFPPVPTRIRIFTRTNIFVQFFRFLILNVKMLRMVRKH
jgi:hypothetical protein